MTNANAREIQADANRVGPVSAAADERSPGAVCSVSSESRAADRVVYRIRALTVEFADAAGGWTRYVVPSQNISRAGLAVLTNQYIYPKTRCRVHILGVENLTQALPASVVRCRYLPGTGRLHEVGLRFETAVDLSQVHRGEGDCRILLCDDDPTIHQIVPRLLNQMNARIRSARSGDEAIHAAMSEPFDVVLMDADLPGRDGTPAVRELRMRGFARPIVALTTLSDPATLRSCLESGFTQIGSRPFTRESLTALIKSLHCEPIVTESLADSGTANRVGAFTAELPERMRQLEISFAKADLKSMQTIARQVRDDSETCGFQIIGTAAGELDAALRSKSATAELRDRLSQLSKLCHAAKTAPCPDNSRERGAAARN
jgi:CheY-like chemotaxis protein